MIGTTRSLRGNPGVSTARTQARGVENFPEHVLGRISWLNGLDPVLGARLRARYDEIDWT